MDHSTVTYGVPTGCVISGECFTKFEFEGKDITIMECKRNTKEKHLPIMIISGNKRLQIDSEHGEIPIYDGVTFHDNECRIRIKFGTKQVMYNCGKDMIRKMYFLI
jgi:hypothetical protein